MDAQDAIMKIRGRQEELSEILGQVKKLFAEHQITYSEAERIFGSLKLYFSIKD